MQTQLTKWGNSAGIRLSKQTLADAGLTLGDTLEIQISDGSISLVPSRKPESLSELLSGITSENTHSPTEWGKPRGKEVW